LSVLVPRSKNSGQAGMPVLLNFMIERYTLPEMGAVWSEQSIFQKWLEAELAVCEVHAEMGTIRLQALELAKS